MEKLKLYEEIATLRGVAGHEKAIKNYMKTKLEVVSDEIIQDKLGGVFGVIKGSSDDVTVMVAAHMDEIGAMVTGITDKGFIKFIPIGGINPEVLVSQNMEIVIDDQSQKTIKGVIGAIPPHMLRAGVENKIDFDNMLLDIGADSKEDAINMGVKLGQQITPVNNFYVTNDNKKIVSKAWDDRIGCALTLEIGEEISKIQHPNKVVIGGTVQEEVGLRGATVASNMVVPDLFIAIDVSPVGDFMNDQKVAFGKLGEGFLVRFYDLRCVMNPILIKYFEKLSVENNIKNQYFKSAGGTDAAAAQYAGNGTLSTTVGVPGRYIHSTATMVHLDDLESVKQMVVAIIKDFSKERLEELLNE